MAYATNMIEVITSFRRSPFFYRQTAISLRCAPCDYESVEAEVEGLKLVHKWIDDGKPLVENSFCLKSATIADSDCLNFD